MKLKRTKDYKRTILLINTGSRRGSAFFERAKTLLKEQRIQLVATFTVDSTDSINQTLQKILAKKPDLLIVGSGDGTVSEVVDYLAYTDIVLAFIPLGTTNNFARSLGLPLNPEAALKIVSSGKVATIDLGKIGDDYFANVASTGISVDVAKSVSSRLKKLIGRGAYALAALKVLLRHKAFEVEITAKDSVRRFSTHQLIIANGRFHAGTLIATDASIDSNSLVIFHLGDHTKFQLLRSLVLFALRKPRTLREGNYTVVRQAEIKTRPRRRLELDGEVRVETPVTVSLATEALKIMAPQNFKNDEK